MPKIASSWRGRNRKKSPTTAAAASPIARRDVHRLVGAVRVARAEVLSRHRRRGAHEPDRRPRDEREELRVPDGKRRLRRRALGERADEPEQQDTPPMFIAMPWMPVGRPNRNSERMIVQSGPQPCPRGNDTTHPPCQSCQSE